ncbi:MAG: malate:quinone oxidoreductase, partial [Pseudomonas sp.]|nr:malate:quinone oxidoreductase [Pseudomonas sp.]
MKKILLTLLCLSVIGCSKPREPEKTVDVLLIGAGVMSATLGTYLHELQPDWSIEIYERLDQVAAESSNGWNNAGTGHSAVCELNYTPETADGGIDISKAIAINESFEISKQFWATQVEREVLSKPKSFINITPHMSFVWGDDRIEYLRKRRDALVKSPLFYGMEYSTDPARIRQWAPLLM